MTASLRTALATVLVVLACGAWTGTSAASGRAASAECGPLDLADPAAVREKAAAVTDVFSGRVRQVERRGTARREDGRPAGGEEPSAGPTRSPEPGKTRWHHTVTVESPFRTELQPGDRLLVITLPSARSRGLGRLDAGATYVFFLTVGQDGDRALAEACAGTTKVAGGLSAKLRDRLDATLGATTGGATPDYTLSVPDDDLGSAPSLGRLTAPGAAVALLGVLGLLLLARIASKRT